VREGFGYWGWGLGGSPNPQPPFPNPPQFRRSLGLGRATAMVVGIIIGASIFVQPSVVTSHVSSIPAAYAAWAAAGALTLFGALVAAELASAFPSSGGVYVFLREAWSPALGFLWGWAMLWSMHSGIVAAIAVVLGRYVGYFVPLGAAATRAVAVAAIVALSAVNYRGVRQGGAVQAALTVAKVGAIVAIVAAGLALGARAGHGAVPAPETAAAGPASALRGFALALGAGLFAFGGWHMVTYTAGETVAPEKTIPRALVIGTLAVTACYIALNAAYFHVLPLATVKSSTRVAADAADAVVGHGGGAVMAGVVVLSTLGALNGVILTGPRVYHSMARDGLLFRWLGEVHPAYHTPHRAIALQAVWASVLVATGSYESLFSQVVYTEWVFFALMALGLWRLRRRPGYAPRFRVWGFPAAPALFILASLAIAANELAGASAASLPGLLLVLVGVPVYCARSAHARH
jgi:APA family basic amino acid/polyamine antiporter